LTEQQVSRLRRVARFARYPAALEMTFEVDGQETYQAIREHVMHVDTHPRTGTALKQINRRHYPRYFLSVPVTVQRFLSPGTEVARGLTLDVSKAGASAVLCGPPEVGEMVKVKLRFLDVSVATLATVRYVSPGRTGFEFLRPEPQLEQKIEDCLRGLLQSQPRIEMNNFRP